MAPGANKHRDFRAPLDHPVMADFVAQLDQVNALADAAEGFVWRLQDGSGNATAIEAFATDMLINMSVWTSAAALGAFVYRSGHMGVLRRRDEWFTPTEGPGMVLWWVPAGSHPTPEEGKQRLAMLAQHGPRPEAFTFSKRFPAPLSVRATTGGLGAA